MAKLAEHPLADLQARLPEGMTLRVSRLPISLGGPSLAADIMEYQAVVTDANGRVVSSPAIWCTTRFLSDPILKNPDQLMWRKLGRRLERHLGSRGVPLAPQPR